MNETWNLMLTIESHFMSINLLYRSREFTGNMVLMNTRKFVIFVCTWILDIISKSHTHDGVLIIWCQNKNIYFRLYLVDFRNYNQKGENYVNKVCHNTRNHTSNRSQLQHRAVLSCSWAGQYFWDQKGWHRYSINPSPFVGIYKTIHNITQLIRKLVIC